MRNHDLPAAEKELSQACEAAKTSREKVIGLNALAQVQILQSRLDEAEKTGKIALALQEKEHWQNTLDYAGTVTNMAEISSRRSSYDSAVKLYQQSISLLDGLQLTDQSQNASRLMFTAVNRLGLATVAKARGDSTEADKQMALAKRALVEHDTVQKK